MYSQRTSSYVTLYSLARFTSLKSATADNFVPVTLCYHPPKLGLIESRIGQPNNTFPGHCDVLETMILKTIKRLTACHFLTLPSPHHWKPRVLFLPILRSSFVVRR